MVSTTTSRPDVQEMRVVHRMFRREYGMAAALVRAVPAGDRARAGVVAAHLVELGTMLHHHHLGEDDLVWPKLHLRTPISNDLVDRMESQHAHVGGLLELVAELLPRWSADGGATHRDALATALDELSPALDQHLLEEERDVLPLIEQHLSAAEWAQLGERAVAAIPKARMLVLFGYVLEDTSPDEQRLMLGVLPAPVRLVYRAVGRRRHERERDQIRAGVVPAQRRPQP